MHDVIMISLQNYLHKTGVWKKYIIFKETKNKASYDMLCDVIFTSNTCLPMKSYNKKLTKCKLISKQDNKKWFTWQHCTLIYYKLLYLVFSVFFFVKIVFENKIRTSEIHKITSILMYFNNEIKNLTKLFHHSYLLLPSLLRKLFSENIILKSKLNYKLLISNAFYIKANDNFF